MDHQHPPKASWRRHGDGGYLLGILNKSQKACTEKAEVKRKSQLFLKTESFCQSKMEATATEPGLCMCLCPGNLEKNKETRRESRPWVHEEAAAVKRRRPTPPSWEPGKKAG